MTETIGDWFKQNKAALAASKRWLTKRKKTGSGESLRGFVQVLRKEYDSPFSDHGSLAKYLRGKFPDLYAEADASMVKPPRPTFKKSAADVKRLDKCEDFIISCAVNNSHAVPGFLAAMERWADERGGQILCTPTRYKNPTSQISLKREDEWWDPALEPYMLGDEIRPHPFLSIMPTKIAATTNNTLPPRMLAMTKARSAVFGHPQLSMLTVPTKQDSLPKLMYTTGAVTEKKGRYSDTLTGDIGEFHHGNSAVIAEVRGKRFHLREVTWDGESFIDVDTMYKDDGIYYAPQPLAMVLGDVHHPYIDPQVQNAVFGKGGMYDVMRPKQVCLHDVLDHKSICHHEMNNHLTRAAMAAMGQIELMKEHREGAGWINSLPLDTDLVVIPSNHDDFLKRWLEAGEKNVEPINKELYHHLCKEMLKGHRLTGQFPMALEVALSEYLTRPCRFLKVDEDHIEADVELGMHGHMGPNGSRGSAKNLAHIGIRSMVGHTHSPRIWQGVYMVGLMGLYRLGYNHGPSSWLHTMAMLHGNGRRQMFHVIDGHFRG